MTSAEDITGGGGMNILIADDHDLVRETIGAFLMAEGFDTVIMAASLIEALDAMRRQRFDLVLLDYDMPGMNGLEGIARARALSYGRPVAVISGSNSLELGEAAIRAGASGFVPKAMASRAMVQAIRRMVVGDIFAPFGLLQAAPVPGDGPNQLTRRETDVLRGICEGKSNKEIARDLDLQEVTVKLHVKTLSRKLNARNRTHAAMIARDTKLA
ncbi:response regulator transcription factor [Paracoccaceae bacterium Fryx2]|nr:response regulator transcription factor [Paracoccaceae bacterium Fryx2]